MAARIGGGGASGAASAASPCGAPDRRAGDDARRIAGRRGDGDDPQRSGMPDGSPTATVNLQGAPGGMTTRRSAPPCASRAARTGNPTSPCSAGGARTPRSAQRPPR
jgi:hypothetical protein